MLLTVADHRGKGRKSIFKKTKGAKLGEGRAGNKSLVSSLPEVYAVHNISLETQTYGNVVAGWVSVSGAFMCWDERLLNGRVLVTCNCSWS